MHVNIIDHTQDNNNGTMFRSVASLLTWIIKLPQIVYAHNHNINTKAVIKLKKYTGRRDNKRIGQTLISIFDHIRILLFITNLFFKIEREYQDEQIVRRMVGEALVRNDTLPHNISNQAIYYTIRLPRTIVSRHQNT